MPGAPSGVRAGPDHVRAGAAPRPRPATRARTPAPIVRTAGSAGPSVHSGGLVSPSTPWGGRSYPESLHSRHHGGSVRPAQLPVYLWGTVIHSLWRTNGASTSRQSCPRAVPRSRALVPRLSTVLHRNIPSSATCIYISLVGVKAATPCCPRGWGEPPRNLGTRLGTTWGQVNWPVGKPCCIHRSASFSTGCVPSQCGQKMGADQAEKGLSTVSTTPTTTTQSRELRIDQKAGGGQICGQRRPDAGSNRLRPISLGCRWSTSDCLQQQAATGAAADRSGGSPLHRKSPHPGDGSKPRTRQQHRQQHTGGGYR